MAQLHPAPLAAQTILARGEVYVALHQPTGPKDRRRVIGRLLSEVRARSELHHYRVSVGEGVVLLVPPHWIDRASHADIERAGLSLPVLDDTHLVAAAEGLAHLCRAMRLLTGIRS